jgi:hypothetical protein
LAALRIPFPDQANKIIAVGADGDSVLVEFWLTGTHVGPLRTPKTEIAPTGKTFRGRVMAIFEFAPGTEGIVCERPYCDRRAVVTALELAEERAAYYRHSAYELLASDGEQYATLQIA